MSDNWISIEDNLPKIGHIIEIKTEKPLSIMNATFTIINWCSENSNYHVNHKHTDVFVFKGLIGDYINNVTHWRPIQEKRPDFGKLKGGDIVIIEDTGIGIYKSIITKIDLTLPYQIEFIYFDGCVQEDATELEEIKKITRINIEKQTFEEI